MGSGQTAVDVKVNAGETATALFSGIAGNACRIDGTIFFNTAKSFIFPQYKPAIEQAFAFGLTRSTTGTGDPVPAPKRFMLIIGHTDQVGSATSNQDLSERRARAALAVFTVDATIWEALYKRENWGLDTTEIETMSAEVDVGGSSDPALIQHYKDDEKARFDLLQRYLLALRPSWLPTLSPPIQPATVLLSPLPDPILGCGFKQLRVKAEGAVQENRRTEFFFFELQDPGVRDCSSYRTWQTTCGLPLTVQIELQDEYGDPYVGSFDLTLPTGGVLSGEKTDSKGSWARDNLVPGQYTVTVAGKSISLLR
ncbi:MAG: hypothetical protein ABI396_09400 [Ktedonobacteraceae bacterium]